MSGKKLMLSLIIILLFSLALYFYFFFLNDREEGHNTSIERNSRVEKSINEPQYSVIENKNYIVYIKKADGSGSSFVPLKLNPNLKDGSDYRVSISFDDDGNVINGEKVIVINNFIISKANKEMIKKISGVENYDEALKEIEQRINDLK